MPIAGGPPSIADATVARVAPAAVAGNTFTGTLSIRYGPGQQDPLDLTTADAQAAGTLYAQAQVQSVVTLANANKAKLNAVLRALRDAGVVK